jgi:hypothetical protein
MHDINTASLGNIEPDDEDDEISANTDYLSRRMYNSKNNMLNKKKDKKKENVKIPYNFFNYNDIPSDQQFSTTDGSDTNNNEEYLEITDSEDGDGDESDDMDDDEDDTFQRGRRPINEDNDDNDEEDDEDE